MAVGIGFGSEYSVTGVGFDFEDSLAGVGFDSEKSGAGADSDRSAAGFGSALEGPGHDPGSGVLLRDPERTGCRSLEGIHPSPCTPT